ncbi:MAG: hypothetical protein KIT73_02465 [Burkholderiales bacterium]|nr:hypothetical protein [Burkholderiales bacterium]
MTRPLVLFVAVFALTATAVGARAEYVTSQQLKGWLEEHDRPNGAFKDRTMALAYVSAVHDQFEDIEICAPHGLQGKRLATAVHLWMTRNPDRWSNNAAVTARLALAESFPCPGKQR